jgi:hypothetical protein
MSDTSSDLEVTEVKSEEAPKRATSDSDISEAAVISMASIFNMRGDFTSEEKSQFKDLYDIFSEGSRDRGDIVAKVSEADRRLSPPRANETRLGNLWRFAKLLEQERGIQDEKKKYMTW